MIALHLLMALAALTDRVVAQDDEEQTTTTTRTKATSTTSTTDGPTTHTVLVGANSHTINPNKIEANVGDTVQFRIFPDKHRIVRSLFGYPCIPAEYANPFFTNGFDSGLIETQTIIDNPTFNVKINDTDPVFFYCAAPGSCVNYKMIGVINPNSTQTIEGQLKAAENVGYQLAPGDDWPSEDDKNHPGGSGGSNNNSGSSGSSSGSDSGSGGGGLSKGAIAGIAIGAAAVLIIAAALIYLCGRRGGFDKAYRKSALLPFGRSNAGSGTNGGAADAGAVPGPDMVEANYANANPKSPGQTTVGSTFCGHDNGALLRNSMVGGGFYAGGGHPPPSVSPGPTLNGSGSYPAGVGGQGLYDPHYPSPHASPIPGNHHATYTPPPVELPTGDPPVPAQSPPPGYAPGHASWMPGTEGQYRPGGK